MRWMKFLGETGQDSSADRFELVLQQADGRERYDRARRKEEQLRRIWAPWDGISRPSKLRGSTLPAM